jgi:methylthioribulose-1-phosphate dehydratase
MSSVIPPLSEASLDARRQLVELGARYHRMGWLFGTSGNLSARFDSPMGDRFVVTASGRDKGRLTDIDFVEVDLEGTLHAAGPNGRPSAETTIHLAVYRTRPDTRVALHVHTVASTLALPTMKRAHPDQPRIEFAGLELIKGWDLWDEGVTASLPVFPNHAHVPEIGKDIEAFYRAHPAERVPALLIATHGITAWGRSFFEANRHLEVTEFLCQTALAQRQLGMRA